ncbi:Csu type fimbrial protein [Neisseria sp. Ec49-e6-T10]|uniref:Csu type fimbrial protein n=1 Tax=Neisseria sp. Ec49-e6-T10 TaxID=3140744 RepID=UPI003EBD3551
MNKIIKKLAITSGLFIMANTYAAEINGNINVSINIGTGCQIMDSTTTGSINNFGQLNFGSHPNLLSVINANSVNMNATPGSLTLNCTTGTNYTVSLDDGQHASSGQRRMSNGTDFIAYNLFKDNSRSTVWNKSSVVSGTSTAGNTNVDLTVYGQVPANATTPTTGAYNDTVTMTVAW